MSDATRLVELLERACTLTRAQLEAFVLEVRGGDPDLRSRLAELLGQLGNPTLAERVSGQYGSQVDPQISLEPAAQPDSTGFASEIVQRLAGRGLTYGRYELKGEVARGGQGAVLRVWDEDLRRNLAMKIILEKGERTGDTPEVDPRTLGRFLEEAQVTGQLDHPGIVPVHELGLDSEGRAYFTMKLVKGEDLRSIFEQVETGENGWNVTRAVGVLLKVCEAMAYAHSKAVIHRDLKPGNVMVGKFGEVFVMDWGLARVLGRDDSKDIRIQEDPQSVVMSDRHLDDTPDSPLITMDGDVVGTPAYMSPEQADGDLQAMGPHSDVYAVGAMLYQLLAQRMPYSNPGTPYNNRAVWYMVRRGPPEPLHALAPDVPAELVSICEKAMAREVSERYPDMLALADDLRAYLEHRVVRAYETGAVAELRKWVQRNKPLALASAAAVVALIGGLAASSSLYIEAKDRAEEAADNALLADTRAREFERVAASLELQQLLAETDPSIWRLDRDDGAMREWLVKARGLVAGLPQHVSDLAKLRESASAMDKGESDALAADSNLQDGLDRQARLRRELQGLDPDDHRRATWTYELEDVTNRIVARTSEHRTQWRLPTQEAQWLHDQLVALIDSIETMQGDQPGRLTIPNLEARLAVYTEAEDRLHGEFAERWAGVERRLRERGESVQIRRSRDLVPLGPDPFFGLEEFALVGTGTVPVRPSPEEPLALVDDSCIVLVLLPGGETRLGKHPDDPQARSNEGVWQATLAPFLLGKHEVTQAQWQHVMGDNPTSIARRPRLPVESVTWNRAVEFCERTGVELPTEAQWSFADRAGSTAVYPWGDDPDEAEYLANLLDRSSAAPDGLPWDDGFRLTAPVGSFEPNAFGLFDMQGNVKEWCRDRYVEHRLTITSPGDALAMRSAPDYVENRVYRGACWADRTDMARSSRRDHGGERTLNWVLGFRVARAAGRP